MDSGAPAEPRRRRRAPGADRGNDFDDFGSRPQHDSYSSGPPRRNNDDAPIGGARNGRAVQLRGRAQGTQSEYREDRQGDSRERGDRGGGDRGGGRRTLDNGDRGGPPPQQSAARGGRRP